MAPQDERGRSLDAHRDPGQLVEVDPQASSREAVVEVTEELLPSRGAARKGEDVVDPNVGLYAKREAQAGLVAGQR